MAESRKRRELLPLIYQHLLKDGYVRSARELKEQSGQKNFPAQPITLLDIYTHWQQTSTVGQKLKAESDAALEAKKARVSDPVSSSESSEEEEEEADAQATKATPRLTPSNSSVTGAALPSNSKEKAKAQPKKASQVVNSTAHPVSRKAPTVSASPSANATLVSKVEKGSVQAPGPTGKLGVASTGQADTSSEDSSSDETDVEMKPPVKPPQVKALPTPAKESSGQKRALTPGKAETIPQKGALAAVGSTKKPEDSEDSEDESESEEEAPVRTPLQAKAVEKAAQVGAASSPAKGTPGKRATPALPGKARPSPTQAQAEKPKEDSESSSEETSNSEEETPAARTPVQVTPAGKNPQVRAASAPTKESPRKGGPPTLSSKTGPTAAQVKAQAGKQEDSESSSEESSSDSEEETPAAKTPPQGKPSGKITQVKAASAPAKDSPRKDTPPLPPSRTGPTATQVKAQAGKQEDSESSSEEESESEEEAPVVVNPAQAKSSGKVLQVKLTSSPAKRPPQNTGSVVSQVKAKRAKEDSDSSTELSDSEEEDSTAQVKSVGKSPPVKAAPSVATGSSKSGSTPPLPGKGPAVTQVKTETHQDSSSEEESDSEDAAQAPTQVKTPQPKASPVSPRGALPKGAVSTPGKVTDIAQAKQGSQDKVKSPVRTPQNSTVSVQGQTSGPATGKAAEEDSESSEEDSDAEGTAPTQAKPSGKAPQVRSVPAPAKVSPQKGANPPLAMKTGPTAAQGGKPEEDSTESSSEEESDSEGEAQTLLTPAQKTNSTTPKSKTQTPAATEKTTAGSLENSHKELLENQVIKTPLIFVDPNRSPAGPAATPARAQAASAARKARASESTAQSSSSESEDEDVIPATQCSTPAFRTSLGPVPTSLQASSVQANSSASPSQASRSRKREAPATQISSALRTHPVTSPQSTPLLAHATNKLKKPEIAQQTTATPSGYHKAKVTGTSDDSDDSSGSSSGSEEDAPSGPRLAPSTVETLVEETPAESSEDEMVEPSQSLLTDYSASKLTQATPSTPRAAPGNKKAMEPQPGTSSCKSGKREANTTPQKAKKVPKSPQALTLSQQNNMALHLLSQPQVQASVMKVLAELFEQERKKAMDSAKESSKKGRGGQKRKLSGDHAATGAPESKKKKQLAPREDGEATQKGATPKKTASPQKTPGTAKGKPKKDRTSTDGKGKKGKESPSPQNAKEKVEGEQGLAKVESRGPGNPKNKKEKTDKKKKDKQTKEKKKKTKEASASTRETDSPLQGKKKKKKKKAEPAV
ncbi:treacle protein isoform X2 [Erinaceus europaeus]|uniref:Treacle protein isoform X2 n=1 Tax=Erinaceus europaeus TaxID=9365 RepID=A0ABM3WKT2_ERIEU|nr:treacle protein isoform X2 [Erinaceus europaeus]